MTFLWPGMLMAQSTATIREEGHHHDDLMARLADVRSIVRDGAKCDGVTDDATAITATIAYCKTNRCKVFIPQSANGCIVTSPINIIETNGLIIEGVGKGRSKIYCTQADHCLQIGKAVDTVYGATNITLRDFTVGSTSTSAKWTIYMNWTSNSVIERLEIVNLSTLLGFAVSGGIFVANAIRITLQSNIIGSIQADGAGIWTSAANGVNIIDNRIDGGAGGVSGIGMHLLGRQHVVTANIVEALLECLHLQAGTGFQVTSNYFEGCGTAILNKGSYLYGSIIEANAFQENTASNTYAIDIQYGQQLVIKGNGFSGHAVNQVNGKYVAINANYATNRDWVVGPNSLYEILGTPPFIDQEIILHAQYADKNMDIVSEHQFFSSKNLLQGTFEAWPTLATAPGPWRYVVAVPGRATDSPLGRYSVVITKTTGSSPGIQTYVYPTISATQNSFLRERYVMACAWIKTDAAAGTFVLTLNDGITVSTYNQLSTASWTRACQGVQIGPTATLFVMTLGVSSDNSSVRVAAPGFWVGTTLPQLPVADPGWAMINAGPLEVDATTHSSTGAGDQQLKAVTIPAVTLGNSASTKVKAVGTVAGTNDAKTVTLVYGGTTLATISELAADTADWSIEAEIINIADTTQRVFITTKAGTAFKQFDYLTAAIGNWAADQVVEVRGNPVNAGDTVSVTYFRVDIGF